jgi:L-histidine Nalpha-methyltransferase
VNARILIDDRLSAGGDLAAEVREGLTRPLRELPPKLFYDARGSELFDLITELPEYYPTRCEREILEQRAREIVDGVGELVELGSGSATKTRVLLDTGAISRYVPVDVSPTVVERCAEELCELYDGLEVRGLIGDFHRDLGHLPSGERRLFAFLGGTIGNLYPLERSMFLQRLWGLASPGDWLLVGTDLVKDREVIEAAYNDSAGVTAEFNLNVLHVLNRGLGAGFDVDAFEHVAFFEEVNEWMDLRLRALCDQEVEIPGADITVLLSEGEEIRTEISAKFTPERIAAELDDAGFDLLHFYSDGMFGLSLARRR